jgi:hypothetical protein
MTYGLSLLFFKTLTFVSRWATMGRSKVANVPVAQLDRVLASGANAENSQPPCDNNTCGDTTDSACRALCRNRVEIDPALAALVTAWPKLPEPIRAGIAAMVKASTPGRGE